MQEGERKEKGSLEEQANSYMGRGAGWKNRVSLCTPGWPELTMLEQAGLKLRGIYLPLPPGYRH